MNNQPDLSSNTAPSLLSWEARGYTLVQTWDGLFCLYSKGDEFVAELSPELRKIEWALLRGHTNYDESSPKISESMFWLCVQAFARKEGDGLNIADFEQAAGKVYSDLAETLGVEILRIVTAQSEEEASEAAKTARSMFDRAIAGMVKGRFPKKARGSGDAFPKEVMAIWTAQGLCGHLRRLPTKAEVREKLEMIGVTYAVANSGDVEGKWRDLFGRSGLYNLPD
jgi:hypothetical protein